MSIPEPAWRKRTRPCPFYSQGRCLFADSCNFLHDIKVRSAVDLPASHAAHAEPRTDSPPRNVHELPSLVVDTVAPHSTGISDQISRYSSLLSVLGDVIGPGPDASCNRDADLQGYRGSGGVLPNLSTASRDSTLATESDATLVGHDSDSVSSMRFDVSLPQHGAPVTSGEVSGHPVHVRPHDTLCHDDASSSSVEPDDELLAEHPSYIVDSSSCPEEFIIPQPAGDNEAAWMACDSQGIQDEPPMMPLRRHSGLTSATSRFSGVSLLASPRDSSRQHPQASPSNSPAQQGSLGLLSPVQLSAKLRPFSLQLIDSAFKRGGSIDSGYADGESWVDPEPLSRSPPPKACPSVVSSPHDLSYGSPTTQDRRVSYDVRPIRRPPSLVQSPEGSILEGPEDESHDVTSSIFDAYDDPSSDVEDDCPSPTMRVGTFADAIEGVLYSAPVSSSLINPDTCLSGEFGYLTPGHNLNPNPGTSVQPFIAVDDNASLKTALSTQPSFEFSDGSSRVFSLRRDSRLSLQSGTSTPNTSLFSHDSDAWRVEEEEPVSPVSDIRTTSSNEKTKRGKRRGVTDESIPPDIACGEVHNEEAQASVMLTRSEEDGKVDTFIDSDITFMPPLPSPYEGRAAKTSNDSKFQENPHLLCSTHESFAGEGATQFPLPLAFELTGHSTLAEDAVPLQNSALDDTAGEQLFPDPLDACTTRPRAASNLTIVADLNNSTMTSALTSAGDEGQQRNRAESDLTVKGQRITRSPPVAANLSVSSMNTMDLTPVIGDDRASFSCSEAADLDSPRTSEVCPSASLESQHSVLQSSAVASSSRSSPRVSRSESVLRPLLTGRKSLLEASLFGDRISRVSSTERSRSNSASAVHFYKVLTREAGSTVVPLGSRQSTQVSTRSSVESTRDGDDCTLQPRCFSADSIPLNYPSFLPPVPHSVSPSGGLKPLRLSTIHNFRKLSSLASPSSSIISGIMSHIIPNPSKVPSPIVSSSASLARNSLLSSKCHTHIPEHIRNSHTPSDRSRPSSPLVHSALSSHSLPTRRYSRSTSAPTQPNAWRLSNYRAGSRNYTTDRRSSTLSCPYVLCEEDNVEDPSSSHPVESGYDHAARPASASEAPVHALATPKPTLLFAIASDDVEQVRKVLDNGEAGPNDAVGPQSALAFTLTNDKLAHKKDIVKALLAYGADPGALRNPTLNPAARVEEGDADPPPETTLEGMDPATRYFVTRADAAHTRQTSRLIYRSFFRPLMRVRYDVIGQDLALEQLFRVLSMHSQRLAVAPIVVLLCGPSGHGKSLLARKFGSLLEVPTHTVNMTTLRSTHDIWQSYSMSPYEEPSSCTLAEFLLENEGKRCVVVLDEIEKTEDQKALWSLLMPWELGRCSLEAGKRHVDVHNIIWLGTSNIGHELVFEYHRDRPEPDKQMTREEYLQLTEMLRPRVSDCLGTSLLSRVTTVLPFVPFTLEEKKAIAAEAVYSLGSDAAMALSPQEVEDLVMRALPNYVPGEGARSLHRAISNQLVDAL